MSLGRRLECRGDQESPADWRGLHPTRLAREPYRVYRGRKPEAGCTREALRGIGDLAFAESCQSSAPSMRVYVKSGRHDVLLVVDMLFQHDLSWAQPVAVALAKAAALKAKKI